MRLTNYEMPQCKKCQGEFPNWMVIEEKKRNLQNRSYCLECSPWKTKRLSTPKYCAECGVELAGRHQLKFCSHSCSATYCNRTRDKKAVASKARQTWATKRLTTPRPLCKICGAECSKPYRITCGAECLHILRSQAPHLKQIAQKGGKASARIQRQQRRSKDEIALFELCNQEFENCQPNAIITDGWDADIVLPDQKIAILWNGPWHYKQLKMPNHSLLQVQNRDRIKIKKFCALGYTTLVFEDRHYTPASAFAEIKARTI